MVHLTELGGEQLAAVTEPGAFLVGPIPTCGSPGSLTTCQLRPPNVSSRLFRQQYVISPRSQGLDGRQLWCGGRTCSIWLTPPTNSRWI